MAIDMTPEQREIGKANFQRVVGQLAAQEEEARKKGVTRRDFMKGLLAAGGATVPTAAAYYGYSHDKLDGKPVKAALIGAGDEGGVLIGEHNPAYLEIVAVCDIRPSNQKRIFKGEDKGVRKGLERIYGKEAGKKIRVFTDYEKMLGDMPEIEAVVIALPLNLHAPVAIKCMEAGKHVLCEKLMAWSISQCKGMIQKAKEKDRVLSIGHQRHYSLLYAHAVEVLNAGMIGDVHHIRALWHRNNTWPRAGGGNAYRDSWSPAISDDDRDALNGKTEPYGFRNLEELVRWRLYKHTGGGLMAELGSHQLDACSIFLGKVRPLHVSGNGGKYFYRDNRNIEDHVFVTFEFPGKNYYAGEKDEPMRVKQERGAIKDAEDKVIVTYSSINTNSFEPYGECVMGTRGTMLVEAEQQVMLWTERDPTKEGGPARSTAVSVSSGGGPALDTSSTTGPGASAAVSAGQASLGAGIPSRGYREEMEHFAYCIRMWNQGSKEERPKPRCDGTAAMADAIIAITANLAMRGTQANGHQPARIAFKPEWFDPETSAVPDADMVKDVQDEIKNKQA